MLNFQEMLNILILITGIPQNYWGAGWGSALQRQVTISRNTKMMPHYTLFRGGGGKKKSQQATSPLLHPFGQIQSDMRAAVIAAKA